MRSYVLKLLKTGVPVAAMSAILGYGFACLAGPYADAQAAPVPGETSLPSARMRVRMPIVLAGMSLAALVAFEGLAAAVRGTKSPPSPTPRASTLGGLDAEVEALLNGILAQTEADRLAQVPPAGTEPSGTGGPRNLSTTH